MPAENFTPGPVGFVSRSGTLTYEIADALSRAGLGQTTCIGTGGDPVIGLPTPAAVRLLNEDPATEVIVIVGEIGGAAEEQAAEYMRAFGKKPAVAFIAGRSAPPGKRMGHAGAIVSGSSGTAESKVKAFEAAGIPVANAPSEIPGLVKKALRTS
jgi:succinyl-CoA synthetase alpha subunit